MFEHKKQKLAPKHVFISRLLKGILLGYVIIGVSLGIGMMGYHFIGELPWIDAFVDAAMIAAGMGPVAPLHSFGAKLFAGFYALYSGLALIITIGVVFTPIIHRFIHAMHVDASDGK